MLLARRISNNERVTFESFSKEEFIVTRQISNSEKSILGKSRYQCITSEFIIPKWAFESEFRILKCQEKPDTFEEVK